MPVRAPLTAVAWSLGADRMRMIVLVAGQGVLEVDGVRHALVSPAAGILPPGPSARLTLEAGARGGIVEAAEAAVIRALPPGPLGLEIRSALTRPQPALAAPQATARELLRTIEAIAGEQATGLEGSEDAIRYHLTLLEIGLWRLAAPPSDRRSAPRSIVREFLHLVELHAREHLEIGEYARRLSVSRGRLLSSVKRATGRTPTEILHDRLVHEAALLIDGSALQVAEIAEMLGFKDAGYFNRFFKRMTGVPPGRRRLQARRRQAEGGKSFAAWP